MYKNRGVVGYSPWDHKNVKCNLATEQQQKTRIETGDSFIRICNRGLWADET